MKRQFHIHQAIKPTFDETEVQLRKYVGFVNAESLNEAFVLSQNDNIDWQKNRTRSTSIGDVIQDGDKLFLVKKVGFKELTAVFEPEESKKVKYIFKYLKPDGSLIGYHLDSFCSVGPKESAKVYNMTEEYLPKQLRIIETNLKYLIETRDELKEPTLIIELFNNVLAHKKTPFMDNLPFSDITIKAEEI